MGLGVAHSNMGLCYGLLRDYPRAVKHHQEALRVALMVQVRFWFNLFLRHIPKVTKAAQVLFSVIADR